MSYEDILYDVKGPVATVTLNRPDSLNSISERLEREMHHAFDAADRDPNVRVIILTGAGRAFSSGYDLSGEGEAKHPPDVSVDEFLSNYYRASMDGVEVILHMWRLGKPIIAAVNGWCMGGGLWYQTACDISVASDKAVFAQPEVRMVSNSTFLFAALCGWKVANRWTLTGDHMDAQEALRASVRLNRAITLQGLLSSGLFNGHLLSGPLSTIVQASVGGPERKRLDEAFEKGGMRGFLDARDGPFLPEPGGPKSRVKAATPE